MDMRTADSGIAGPTAPGRIAPALAAAPASAFGIIAAISVCHCLNDLLQSLVPALYPILKESYALDFGQVGLITLAFQLTASVLQPFVGIYTDRHPLPYSLPVGMMLTLAGLLLLSVAGSYAVILGAAALIGMGSSVFHPESSRVVRMASGSRHGSGQSLFQVGGNFGSAMGPVLAAVVVVPRGQSSVAWFSAAALAAMLILARIGSWYAARIADRPAGRSGSVASHGLPRRRVALAIGILVVLAFSKNFYTAGLTSYYTFYLIHHFGVSVQEAQIALFVFLASLAIGTLVGGPFSDRFGSRIVIWISILGSLPFTLALPHVSLPWTIALTVPIGVIVGSATPQIVVFGMELLPGRIGLVSGLFLGLSFGMGGLGAAFLGELADRTSIEFVYQVCAWLPAIGLLAAFLPNTRALRADAIPVRHDPAK